MIFARIKITARVMANLHFAFGIDRKPIIASAGQIASPDRHVFKLFSHPLRYLKLHHGLTRGHKSVPKVDQTRRPGTRCQYHSVSKMDLFVLGLDADHSTRRTWIIAKIVQTALFRSQHKMHTVFDALVVDMFNGFRRITPAWDDSAGE